MPKSSRVGITQNSNIMKRITLLTATFLLTTMVTFANHGTKKSYENNNGLTTRYRNAEPVTFVERGVRFFVFPNGQFDFDVVQTRYGRRGNPNIYMGNRGGKFVNGNKPYRRGHLLYDRFGRISKVKNVPVFYDRAGRVYQIGSVFMNYGRSGLLNQVGALDARYSRYGKIIYRYGNVHNRYGRVPVGTYQNGTIVCRG